jgi:hypothetical protein
MALKNDELKLNLIGISKKATDFTKKKEKI